MSAAVGCDCPCATPIVSEVPGSDGTDGVNAYTLTSVGFVIPAPGSNVDVYVLNTTWMGVGQNIYIPDAGTFEVTAIPTSTKVTLQYLSYTANTNQGNTITAGTPVVVGGIQGAAGTGGSAVGVASPEGVVTADPGAVYLNSATTSFYVKESGTGNTGWTLLIGPG